MTKDKENIDVQEKENQQKNDIVPGFDSLENFELAVRTSKILAKSSLVPKEYRGNVPNCMIALNMANRMNADPLMVMQNLYIVHGKPGWSAQFLISIFNTSGRFSPIRYNWVGKEGTDSWGCQAWAIEKETGEKIEGSTITIKLAKEEGWYSKIDKNGNECSKWQTMPEQMLMYRAAAWFIRTYAPEFAMGMYTEDEIIDVTPGQYSVEDEVENEINQNANKEELDIEEKPEPKEEPEENDNKSEKEEKDEKKQKQTSLNDNPGF